MNLDHVRDSETIVLGGLFQDVDSDTVTKLPLLGDLPVLGGFFRNRQRTHNRDEVVFFITPHIPDRRRPRTGKPEDTIAGS